MSQSVFKNLWAPDIAPDKEPNRVLIHRGEWVDETRGSRKVPFKIYYPDVADKKLPVIIWSHGLGGTRDGAGFLSRFLASHEYIHVNIQHDGSDDSLWRNDERHPWDAIRDKLPLEWDVVRDRYLDVAYALTQLQSGGDNPCFDLMDMSALGISGHSFGAMTTQVISGQLAGKGSTPEHFYIPEFKAGILYSPVPTFRLEAPEQDIYGAIQTPLLFMTGTEDDSPVEGFDHTTRAAIFDLAGTPKNTNPGHMLLVIDGADHMVFNGSRGQLPDYAGIDHDKDVIKIAALAWWDWHLKDDTSALKFIKSRNMTELAGKNGELRFK